VGTITVNLDGRDDVAFTLHPTEDKVLATCTRCREQTVITFYDDPEMDLAGLVQRWDEVVAHHCGF
jgi:hypothetical protein